jgi:hypothetical protein
VPALWHRHDLDEGVVALPGLPLQGRLLLTNRPRPPVQWGGMKGETRVVRRARRSVLSS